MKPMIGQSVFCDAGEGKIVRVIGGQEAFVVVELVKAVHVTWPLSAMRWNDQHNGWIVPADEEVLL